MSFSSKLKKGRVAREMLIAKEISILEKKLMESDDSVAFSLENEQLHLKKAELEELTAYQLTKI